MQLPRMTTRRWMIAVAVMGIILGVSVELQRRHARFLDLATHHEASSQIRRRLQGRVGGPYISLRLNGLGEDVSDWSGARVEWHRRVGEKYSRAAHYPWLPVEPDPSPE